MYTVLLVDDEPWALIGLRNIVDWESVGFTIVAQMTDPIEAFDFIQTKTPDVIFTDIMMFEITGIDLIRKSREAKINSEFVIVSGYGEFSYAKEAINHNVFSYLMKPIDRKEILELLEKLRITLELKQINEDRVSDTSLLECLFKTPRKLYNIFQENGLTLEYKYFQVVIISGISPQIKSQLKMPKNSKHVPFKLGFNKYVYFINSEKDIKEFAACEWNCKAEFSGLVFGISTVCQEKENIYEKFREADMAVYSEFILEEKGIFYYIESNNFDIKQINEEVLKIKSGNIKHISNFIERIPVEFKENNFGIKIVAIIYNQIVAYMTNNHGDIVKLMDFEFAEYDVLQKKYGSITEMCKYILEVLQYAMNKTSQIDTSRSSSDFKGILDFIYLNYEKDLYLNDVAKKFCLNLTYLCELFKKNTGKTFVEYLTYIRMTEATKLLNESSLSINQVAEKVGYNDYYHFNKMYKRYFGKTPTMYRKEKN